jgi:hypothetical protein
MVFPCRMRSTRERERRPSTTRSSVSWALASRRRRRSSRQTRRLRTALFQVLGLLQRGSWPRGACPYPYPGPRARPKQGPFPPASFWSTPSTVLRAPRTPSQHGDTSPSAYSHRLRPTWAAGEGLSCSIPGLRCVPPPVPRGCPAGLRSQPSAVYCLRRDMIGSATPPFGFLSHGAAEIHSCWARSFAPAPRGLRPAYGFRRSAQTPPFLTSPGACYTAHPACLPWRDSHPLVWCSIGTPTRASVQDAT